jgi:hypothetical protein
MACKDNELKSLKCSGYYLYQFHFAHSVYLYVLYYSENEQRNKTFRSTSFMKGDAKMNFIL